LTKNEIRPKTAPTRSSAVRERVEHRRRVGEREGDLLHRRRARLLEVVGADVDRVPARHVLDRVGDHVRRQPQRWPGGEGVGSARQELLEDVVLGGSLEHLGRDTPLLGDRDVEREQPGSGRVDRHRGVHLRQVDPVEQGAHVAEVGDRHTDLADLAARQRIAGVVAGLGRQVERDGEPGLAAGEVLAVKLVRGLRRGMAGVGPHQPRWVWRGKTVGRTLAAHRSWIVGLAWRCPPPRYARSMFVTSVAHTSSAPGSPATC
jgi:hypothetical protein